MAKLKPEQFKAKLVKKELREVKRSDLILAMAICDAMGRVNFLLHYGYKPSHTYKLRYKDTDYDSKAIVGVAAGRAASEFSGGVSRLRPVLRRCGFDLVNVKAEED